MTGHGSVNDDQRVVRHRGDRPAKVVVITLGIGRQIDRGQFDQALTRVERKPLEISVVRRKELAGKRAQCRFGSGTTTKCRDRHIVVSQ